MSERETGRDPPRVFDLLEDLHGLVEGGAPLEPEALARRHAVSEEEVARCAAALEALAGVQGGLPRETGSTAVHVEDGPPPPPKGASDTLVGRQLGQCRLERLLGEGAFGQVYRAHHLGLDAPVAVKVLARRGSGVDERFVREAQALARVRHPNLVSVLDYAEQDGQPYMVEELLQGESLAELLERRGRLDLDETLELGLQVSSALVALHEAGLIHRDLKPDNIMMTSSGAKIIDLGLVYVEDATRLTRPGLILGTPQFMAPEQIGIKEGGFGPPADVYALGGVLFKCLSGQAPHAVEGDDGLRSFLDRRASEAPTPLGELRPDLPGVVCELVDQLLRTDPGERPVTADVSRSLLDARRRCRASRATPKMGDRRLWFAGLGAALVVVLVVVLGGLPGRAERPEPQPFVKAPEPEQTSPLSPDETRPLLPAAPSTRPTAPRGTTRGAPLIHDRPEAAAPKPTPKPEPPPLERALAALRALRFDRADVLLATEPDAGEVRLASALVRRLRLANGDAPLPRIERGEIEPLLDAAPRTRVLWTELEEGLRFYLHGRRAVEQQELGDLMERARTLPRGQAPAAAFLLPERRAELGLLIRLARVGEWSLSGRNGTARAELAQIAETLDETPLGRRLAPWLATWEESIPDPLGRALESIRGLRFDEAAERLAEARGAPEAELLVADRLVRLLEQTAGDAPMARIEGQAWTSAPRAYAALRYFDPGLTTYRFARLCAERRNLKGLVVVFRKAEDTGQPLGANYLPRSQRGELGLLMAMAEIGELSAAGRRSEAHQKLKDLLASAHVGTPLGVRLVPWLRTWRQRIPWF